MGIRTNWHTDDVPVDTSDPFAPSQLALDGDRIDLTAVDLEAQLARLMLVEGALYERGLTCWLKDRPDTCCSACPLFGHDPIAELCKLGRAQERTMMSMLAADA